MKLPATEFGAVEFSQTVVEDWSHSMDPPAKSDSERVQKSRQAEIDAAERLLRAEADRLGFQRKRLTEMGKMAERLHQKIGRRETELKQLKQKRDQMRKERTALYNELEWLRLQPAIDHDTDLIPIANLSKPPLLQNRLAKSLVILLITALLGILIYEKWFRSALIKPNKPEPIAIQFSNTGLYDDIYPTAEPMLLRSTDQLLSPTTSENSKMK